MICGKRYGRDELVAVMMTGSKKVTRTVGRTSPPVTWRERAFVLGGIGVAATAVGGAAGEELGGDILAPVWLGAAAWTVAAIPANALWRGIRHGESR